MNPRSSSKAGLYVLSVFTTLATIFYFNYLFFHLRDQFAFGNRDNLWVSALHGAIYIVAAWQCGKFAQRRGNMASLKVGYASLFLLMLAGGFLPTLGGQLFIVTGYSVALLFIWPAMEAALTEGETRIGMQRRIGLFNCIWAGAAALAYFIGGKFYDLFGIGAVFWLPAGIYGILLIYVSHLARQPHLAIVETEPVEKPHPEKAAFEQPVPPATFLKMAWLANPFAYVAINTILAVMPGIALRLGLTPSQVGLFCAVWFLGRFAAFVLLWRWTGWHYRFRWMLLAFLALIGGFAGIVLGNELWILVVAQAVFGLAAGLFYYASLFYSMDVGETKSEHGGLHEAAIGAGICGGPLIGALTLTLLPDSPDAGVKAVGALLVVGLLGLLWLRWRR